jgi:hypothetical protein
VQGKKQKQIPGFSQKYAKTERSQSQMWKGGHPASCELIEI